MKMIGAKLINKSDKLYHKEQMMEPRLKKFPTKTIAFDVDGTLVLYAEDLKLSKKQIKAHKEVKEFYFSPMGIKLFLIPHTQNIAYLKECWTQGFEILVWSAGSKEWAEAVIKQLHLSPYVDIITTKPEIIVDDLEVNEWIGIRKFYSYIESE
jgi:phosphoglycolate phosphatase-like HAD superfamily hydrolase